MLQNATLSGNQRPDLLTSLMNMSLVLRLPREMHLSRSSSNVPRLPSFLKLLQNPRVLLTFDKVHNPLRLPRKTTSERPKVLRTPLFLHFWLRNVLRATTACTFSTCQLPKVVRAWRVLTFWLGNVLRATTVCTFSTSQQKWSEHGVFCAFWLWNVLCATTTSKSAPTYWLGNVLRATAARTFSTSQLLKVLRGWGVLYILTWKCASRHNGVQLFIPHLARWLRTRRFSEPTFPPSRATNHWKNTVFRDFPTFSRTWIFFLLRLSLLWSSFFLFSDSSHLCVSSAHTVGSLTPKHPSAGLHHDYCNLGVCLFELWYDWIWFSLILYFWNKNTN